jgi:large subunit ribosomal protein L4e
VKVNLYSTAGKAKKKVDLPDQFETPLRIDIIRRSVTASRANRRQPYGSDRMAGMKHSVEQWGKGRGTARNPRLKGSRRGAEAPLTVGGRRAHPPKVEKIWTKKVNRKERRYARLSALAATADKEAVAARGHRFSDKITLPVIVEDKFEKIATAQDALAFFEKIGISDDVTRAKEGRYIRAGKGKMRSRRFRTPRSILIITVEPGTVHKAVSNLPGISAVPVSRVSVEDLAPGGDPGRLTLFTESALKEVNGWL